MAGNRPDIDKAQKAARRLLAMDLSEIVPDENKRTRMFDHVGDTTLESFLNWDIDKMDTKELATKKFKLPEKIDVKLAMDLLASDLLGDLFVGAEKRKAAQETSPEKYAKFLENVWKVSVYAVSEPDALKKFHAYTNALSALADDGKRPSPDALKDGIAVMQDLLAFNKEAENTFTASSQSVSALRDQYYGSLVSNIIMNVMLKENKFGGKLPLYIDAELEKRIVAYKKRVEKDEIVSERNEKLKQEVLELVMKNEPKPRIPII